MNHDTTTRPVEVEGEELDELLYDYPTPAEATRAELPLVHLHHNGDHWLGVILGYGTSYEEAHTHVPGGRPGPGERCSGCRWTDVTIMWAQPLTDTDDDGTALLASSVAPWQYAVIVRGRSAIPGETQRVRMTWTPDAAMVLDSLYVPVPKRMRVTGRERSIAGPHEDAFLDAASLDEGLGRVADEYTTDQAGAR